MPLLAGNAVAIAVQLRAVSRIALVDGGVASSACLGAVAEADAGGRTIDRCSLWCGCWRWSWCGRWDWRWFWCVLGFRDGWSECGGRWCLFLRSIIAQCWLSIFWLCWALFGIQFNGCLAHVSGCFCALSVVGSGASVTGGECKGGDNNGGEEQPAECHEGLTSCRGWW